MNNSNKGFTLVELAIVLVIIGLLVGGVLQGQELIKQAQIRSFISQLSGYDAAVNTFRAKYRELPGDMTKAVTFGLNAGETSLTEAATTEYGNGDGKLQSIITAGSISYAAYGGEIANFWVHLSYSKLIKGSIACAATAAVTCATLPLAGQHFPESAIGVGVVAVSVGSYLYYLTGLYGGFTAAGAITAVADNASGASALGLTLIPEEAFALDSKLDDGKPESGIVTTIDQYNGAVTAPTLTQAACGTSGDYVLTTTTPVCSLAIRASM